MLKREWNVPLKEKQIFSFISSYLNHIQLRNQIYLILSKSDLLNKNQIEFLNFIHKTDLVEVGIDDINTDNFSVPNIPEEVEDDGYSQIDQDREDEGLDDADDDGNYRED